MTSTVNFVIAALLVFTGPSALSQKLDEIPFFKGSVGTWKGTGKSLVEPTRNKLTVSDNWRGEFAKEGEYFVQTGKVTLSNGGAFEYRWIYRYEKDKLIALYSDSNQTKSIALVKLSEDKMGMSVSPANQKLEPLRAGLFSTAKLVGGKFVYEAQVRDAGGKATVDSKVSCTKQVAPAGTK